MRTFSSLCGALACGLLLSAPALADGDAPPPTLDQLHEAKDPAHTFSVFNLESAIEDVNRGGFQVFGARREIRCPSGDVVAESRCDPCVMAAGAFGQTPEGEWALDLSWKTEPEHLAANQALEHFGAYFELLPRPATETGGVHHLVYAFTGKKKIVAVADLKLSGGGAEKGEARIAPGATSVLVEATAFRAGKSGLEPFAGAKIKFSAACAKLEEPSPGKVNVSLAVGTQSCQVDVVAEPGDVTRHFNVRREVDLQITYEGQAADEVEVHATRTVDLSYTATALGKPYAVTPQWKGQHGTFAIKDSGKKVVFTLDSGEGTGEVQLVDPASGASDVLVVRRPAIKP